jgi:hypothetical protein
MTGCKLAGGCKFVSTLKMYISIIKILNCKNRIIKNIYINIGVEASVKIYNVSSESIVNNKVRLYKILTL